jgi:hypothetical protein
VKLVRLGLALVAFVGCGATQRSPARAALAKAGCVTPAGSVIAGTVVEKITTDTAAVHEVDWETRAVAVRRPDGTAYTIVVAPDVDLGQFEPGDQLTLTYRESIAFRVRKPDQAKPGVAHTTDVTYAPHGAKPG